MLYRTLCDLRGELSRRLGFGAQGSAGINSGLLDSFLQNAQDQLWAAHDWRNLLKYDEKVTGVGESLYDWADDCDPGRLVDIAVSDGARWIPMQEGISFEHRSTADRENIPVRYERFAQMEVWPNPDGAYTIRRYFIAKPLRFTQDSDRASIDDAAVLLHAITNAKLHYKQSDGQAYAAQLNTLLARLKGQSRGQSTFRRGGDPAPAVRPRVV